MRIISSPSKQNPSSLTRFLCWSLASIRISFLNCTSPWTAFLESLLTATSRPSGSLPLNKEMEGSLAFGLKKPTDKFEACENVCTLPCKRSRIHLVQAYYHQKSLLLQPGLLQDWFAGTEEFHFLPLWISKESHDREIAICKYYFHRKNNEKHHDAESLISERSCQLIRRIQRQQCLVVRQDFGGKEIICKTLMN